jgi:hypothetical protein
MDVFFAAIHVGAEGRVVGVDFTAEPLAKARGVAADGGFERVEFREGPIEQVPVDDGGADCAVCNATPTSGRRGSTAPPSGTPTGRGPKPRVCVSGRSGRPVRAHFAASTRCEC